MELPELRTTKSQIEEFKESILWADMVMELNLWKEGFESEMRSIVDLATDNNPSTASVLLHMGDLNGRIKAVDYILSMLDVFLSILNIEPEDKEDDFRRNETD
jgi:hypothetical protein